MDDQEESPKNWLALITDSVLGRAGPAANMREVTRADRYKVAGPAAAKAVILSQPNTVDVYGTAERLRK